MTESQGERVANNKAHYPGGYLPAVDGLRAIAVLSVILFHLDGKLLPGGFVGVDVFFVISGYVITRSLAKSNAPSFRVFVLDFYKRRVLRLLPALVVCLLLTSLFAKLFIPAGFWLSADDNWTGLWAFFGVSNLYLVNNVDGYFAARTPFNPYVHTWSLAVEEQFYLFFPLILYLWLRLRATGNRHHRMMFAVLPIIALTSLAWAAYATEIAPERAFYLLPSRFWELAIGAMLYQFHTYRQDYFSQASRWITPLGLLILGVAFGLTDGAHFPFPWALVPVLGTTLLLAGTATTKTENSFAGRLLAGRSLSYIGRISYSLYLWHWPVLVLCRWTIGLATPGDRATALSLTFALAILSYHFIEVGLRGSRVLASQPSWRIVAGGALTAYAGFFLVTQLFYANHLQELSLSVTNNVCLWNPYDDGCQHEAKATPTRRNLFVIGDSHAGAYSLMATMAADRLGATVYIRSFAGCPIAKLIWLDREHPACRGYVQKTLRWLDQRAKAGDIVFLASLRLHRLGDQWGTFDLHKVLTRADSEKQAEINRQSLAEAEDFVERLKPRGLYVLMDAPLPEFKSPPFRCSDWFNRNNPVCTAGFSIDRGFLLKYREPTMASLRTLHEELGVYLWDPLPVVCPQATCSAFDGNKPIFQDGDHLSAYGDRLLVDSFTDRLSSIWAHVNTAGMKVSASN